MKIINFSDARKNLKAVLDGVIDDADVAVITRRDAEDVVVMPLSEWSSWKETEYLLASPANARRLLKAIKDLDAGRFVERELIDASNEPKQRRAAHKLEPRVASKQRAPQTRKKRG